MTTWPILSVVTFLPVVGALLIYLSRGDDEAARRNARWIALWTTLITFAVSLILVWRFDAAQPDFQFVEKAQWLASGITYHMGVDGISLPFVILTTALMPFCIIASWKSITARVGEYMMAFLLLETLMIGTFSALDLVLFYLFFEGGLIPMFLIIGVWGGPRRVYASFKFFLYTLLGSVLMLLAIMALYWNAGTTDIPTLMHTAVPRNLQTWAWLAFFASFAVKMPMWPVHTWLPDAHVEAPTAGSVVLAAILLKMGGYGFLRFSLPMFPLASHDFAPLIFGMSVIAIIYTSLRSARRRVCVLARCARPVGRDVCSLAALGSSPRRASPGKRLRNGTLALQIATIWRSCARRDANARTQRWRGERSDRDARQERTATAGVSPAAVSDA